VRINVPTKTQLYIDQAKRERENAQSMYKVFQRDLASLQLIAARQYAKVVSKKMTATVNVEDVQMQVRVLTGEDGRAGGSFDVFHHGSKGGFDVFHHAPTQLMQVSADVQGIGPHFKINVRLQVRSSAGLSFAALDMPPLVWTLLSSCAFPKGYIAQGGKECGHRLSVERGHVCGTLGAAKYVTITGSSEIRTSRRATTSFSN
jgi:hypothetical protein